VWKKTFFSSFLTSSAHKAKKKYVYLFDYHKILL
jgi:hypothetical protein